jgi:hypothetical protein
MKAMVVRCYYCGNAVPVDATVRIKVRTGRLCADDEIAGETRQRVDFCRWCAQAVAPRQYDRAQRIKKLRRKQIAEWVARRRRPADES